MLIHARSFALSDEVNKEILEPISKWLDDPDWLEKFKASEDAPDWADYKRKQREWTKEQKELARTRLKLYWQEIHRKRSLRTELSKLIGKPTGTTQSFPLEPDGTDQTDQSNQTDFITLLKAPEARGEGYQWPHLDAFLMPYLPSDLSARKPQQKKWTRRRSPEFLPGTAFRIRFQSPCSRQFSPQIGSTPSHSNGPSFRSHDPWRGHSTVSRHISKCSRRTPSSHSS
jgi:hypothetical protein